MIPQSLSVFIRAIDFVAILPVIILRLLIPFSIRRWPFWGGVAALAADTADSWLLRTFGWDHANGNNYQLLDKFLDTYYLAFEWTVVLQLREKLLRRALGGLFWWRVLGVVVFEITHIRQVLVFAPNIFEYLYLFTFGARRYKPVLVPSTPKKLMVALAVIGAPKLLLEYIMHFREYPLGLGRIWDLVRMGIWKR